MHFMFIAALFTISKTWKQPKCPSTNEKIKKMLVPTMEYYSVTKKNKMMPFAGTQMNLPFYQMTYMLTWLCLYRNRIFKECKRN